MMKGFRFLSHIYILKKIKVLEAQEPDRPWTLKLIRIWNKSQILIFLWMSLEHVKPLFLRLYSIFCQRALYESSRRKPDWRFTTSFEYAGGWSSLAMFRVRDVYVFLIKQNLLRYSSQFNFKIRNVPSWGIIRAFLFRLELWNLKKINATEAQGPSAKNIGTKQKSINFF